MQNFTILRLYSMEYGIIRTLFYGIWPFYDSSPYNRVLLKFYSIKQNKVWTLFYEIRNCQYLTDRKLIMTLSHRVVAYQVSILQNRDISGFFPLNTLYSIIQGGTILQKRTLIEDCYIEERHDCKGTILKNRGL